MLCPVLGERRPRLGGGRSVPGKTRLVWGIGVSASLPFVVFLFVGEHDFRVALLLSERTDAGTRLLGALLWDGATRFLLIGQNIFRLRYFFPVAACYDMFLRNRSNFFFFFAFRSSLRLCERTNRIVYRVVAFVTSHTARLCPCLLAYQTQRVSCRGLSA